MIKSIKVKNFKTLRDVEIPLDPKITVMVGANNSGKSNALQVFKLVGETERRAKAATLVTWIPRRPNTHSARSERPPVVRVANLDLRTDANAALPQGIGSGGKPRR